MVASHSPGHCFDAAIEACRIALKYRTPVILLSDGYLANAAEPWMVPELDDLPELRVELTTDPEGFQPYSRDEKGARPWVKPGTPGLECVGGRRPVQVWRWGRGLRVQGCPWLERCEKSSQRFYYYSHGCYIQTKL